MSELLMLIGVAGPMGAGKARVAREIQARFPPGKLDIFWDGEPAVWRASLARGRSVVMVGTAYYADDLRLEGGVVVHVVRPGIVVNGEPAYWRAPRVDERDIHLYNHSGDGAIQRGVDNVLRKIREADLYDRARLGVPTEWPGTALCGADDDL